jgi:hypothetical protein
MRICQVYPMSLLRSGLVANNLSAREGSGKYSARS